MARLKSFMVNMLIIAISVVALAVGCFFASSSPSALDNESRASIRFERAVVEAVGKRVDLSSLPDSVTDIDIHFTCKVLSGEDKGKTIEAIQNISSYMGQDIKEIESGDKIIITLVENTALEENVWYFAEYVRSDTLVVLLILFFVALLIFGRASGLKTIVSLTLTVGAVFFMLIPSIFSGQNIYVWSIIVCLYIVIMTLCVVNGLRSISLVAGLGCVAGIVFSSLMFAFSDYFMKLTGFVDECSIYLSLIDMNGKIDLRGLVFAAVTIGSVGAIMDVAVNISASLHEIAVKVKTPSAKELILSGFTIGKDIIGTMSNTLILAYIGSSVGFVLLVIYNSSNSSLYLFNREIIVVEVLKILIGSLGILMTIPLSSVICGHFYTRFGSFGAEKKSSDTPNDKDTDELLQLARKMHESD